MSHVQKNAVVVKSIGHLRAAAKECGAEILENTPAMWWGNFMGDSQLPEGWTGETIKEAMKNPAYTIRHPDACYDVAVLKNKDGTYSLFADTWASGGLEEVYGKSLSKLAKAYTKHTILDMVRRHGHSGRITKGKNNNAIYIEVSA